MAYELPWGSMANFLQQTVGRLPTGVQDAVGPSAMPPDVQKLVMGPGGVIDNFQGPAELMGPGLAIAQQSWKPMNEALARQKGLPTGPVSQGINALSRGISQMGSNMRARSKEERDFERQQKLMELRQGVAAKKEAEAEQKALLIKQRQAKAYWGILENPNAPPAAKKKAGEWFLENQPGAIGAQEYQEPMYLGGVEGSSQGGPAMDMAMDGPGGQSPQQTSQVDWNQAFPEDDGMTPYQREQNKLAREKFDYEKRQDAVEGEGGPDVAAKQIEQGMQNVANVVEKYKDTIPYAFGNIQGGKVEPGDYLGSVGQTAGRAYGSIASGVARTEHSPTEVREEVQNSLLAVAAVVKNIVRQKGEGIWTDADQKLVNDIVGSVETSPDYETVKRRIKLGVDRMNAVFGPRMGVEIRHPTFGKAKKRYNPDTGRIE